MKHQFTLFGWQKPKAKVPISEAQIRAAQAEYEAGDTKGAVERMREVRYKLEAYAARIGAKKK